MKHASALWSQAKLVELISIAIAMFMNKQFAFSDRLSAAFFYKITWEATSADSKGSIKYVLQALSKDYIYVCCYNTMLFW